MMSTCCWIWVWPRSPWEGRAHQWDEGAESALDGGANWERFEAVMGCHGYNAVLLLYEFSKVGQDQSSALWWWLFGVTPRLYEVLRCFTCRFLEKTSCKTRRNWRKVTTRHWALLKIGAISHISRNNIHSMHTYHEQICAMRDVFV